MPLSRSPHGSRHPRRQDKRRDNGGRKSEPLQPDHLRESPRHSDVTSVAPTFLSVRAGQILRWGTMMETAPTNAAIAIAPAPASEGAPIHVTNVSRFIGDRSVAAPVRSPHAFRPAPARRDGRVPLGSLHAASVGRKPP